MAFSDKDGYLIKLSKRKKNVSLHVNNPIRMAD